MENYRKYGSSPYKVVLVHGGPGAPGEMAPVARELSKDFGVLEPLQTRSSLMEQIGELKKVLEEQGNLPVVLTGWSWGAWLSFLVTVKYPALVKKLIMINSGPFEDKYAAGIMATRMSRFSEKEKTRVKELIKKISSPGASGSDRHFSEFGKLLFKVDSFDPTPRKDEVIKTQVDVYSKVWPEANKLRKSGELLRLGRQIKCPVVAIHGDYDPHPAEGVKKPLRSVLKNFKFILLKNCGHHPWYERGARKEFYGVIRQELP